LHLDTSKGALPHLQILNLAGNSIQDVKVENGDGEEEATAEGILPEMAELVLSSNPIATANGGEKLKKIM
jgi:Leucine-rich repeat (LRR) protein